MANYAWEINATLESYSGILAGGQLLRVAATFRFWSITQQALDIC